MAIRQHSGLGLARWQPSNRDPNSTAAGFVLNLADHWFTLRPVFGIWLNFNSMLPRPSRVGPAYLSAFLAQMSMSGYSIFEVTGGALPPPVQPRNEGIPGPGRVIRAPSWGSSSNWHRLAELVNPPSENRPAVVNRAMSEEEQLHAAIAASLTDSTANENQNSVSRPVIGTVVGHGGSSCDDDDLSRTSNVCADFRSVMPLCINLSV